MKRYDQKVPGFDEIIFANRNKSYGAYDLRRRYKSAASLSILGGVMLSSVPLILTFIFSPEPVKAKADPGIFVVVQTDNLTDPAKIAQPEPLKPASAPPQFRYVEPKVVDDTIGLTNLLINDFVMDSVINNNVTVNIDSVVYSPPVTAEIEEPEPFTFVEEPPVFPGGTSALLKFIAENTKYPAEALENGVQGKVFVKFAVSADGTVKRLEITRSVHPLLDAEAMRVVSSLPKWKPGKQNGRPVPVWYSVPVTFEIRNY
jgi:periplasmic protein TonB